MSSQILNAVWIVNLAILSELIVCTKTILGNNHWQAIAGIHLTNGRTEAWRVNLPAKLSLSEVRIIYATIEASLATCLLLVCTWVKLLSAIAGCHSSSIVIVEADEIRMTTCENFLITWLKVRSCIIFFKISPQQIVVLAPYCHIKIEPVADSIVVLSSEHILRLAGSRIYKGNVWSRTNLCIRKHFMAESHNLSLCYHHVMILLISLLQNISTSLWNMKCTNQRTNQGQHILLIDSEPVLYSVTEVLEHNLSKVYEPVNGLTIAPGTALIKSSWHIEVEHGYQWLDVVLQALINKIIIVFNTFRIYSASSLRNKTAPGNGKTIGFKAHLCHESDIFLITVILVSTHL